MPLQHADGAHHHLRHTAQPSPDSQDCRFCNLTPIHQHSHHHHHLPPRSDGLHTPRSRPGQQCSCSTQFSRPGQRPPRILHSRPRQLRRPIPQCRDWPTIRLRHHLCQQAHNQCSDGCRTQLSDMHRIQIWTPRWPGPVQQCFSISRC